MKKSLFTLFISLIILSCKNDELVVPVINITDVAEVSSTSVIVKASVERGTEPINENGFLVGATEGIRIGDAIEAVDLSDTTFAYDFNNLAPDNTYFFRAYVVTESGEYYSDPVSASTDIPVINAVEPDTIVRGAVVELTGSHLSSNLALYDITLGGESIVAASASLENLELKIPVRHTPGWQELNIELNGTDLLSQTLYISHWAEAQEFPHNIIWANGALMAFEDYVISVMDRYDPNGTTESRKNDLWKYDVTTDEWSLLDEQFPGEYRENPITIVSNGKGYLAMGVPSFRDFWEYDPTTLQWSQLQNIPDTFDNRAILVDIANELYIYQERQLAHFNRGSGEWEIRSSLDIGHNGFYRTEIGFGLNGFGYFLARETGTITKVFKYDPVQNSWSVLPNDVPSEVGYYYQTFSFENNGVGVVGGGYLFSERLTEYYTFNPETGDWNSFHQAPFEFHPGATFSANRSDLFVRYYQSLKIFTPNP